MVKIEISNRLLYTFIALVVTINAIAISFAIVDTTQGWHPASQIDTSTGLTIDAVGLTVTSGNIDVQAGNIQASGTVCDGSSNCLNTVATGIPVFRFCTNAQSDNDGIGDVPECVAAASNGGQGDNNNRGINCKAQGVSIAEIAGDISWNFASWRYVDENGVEQACIDGSLMIISF